MNNKDNNSRKNNIINQLYIYTNYNIEIKILKTLYFIYNKFLVKIILII